MSIDFSESRRLTGANVFFDGTGAALEAIGADIPDSVIERWREAIVVARTRLRWPDGAIVWRRHRSGVSLAYEAPADQLVSACEVNEWALSRATASEIGFVPGDLVEAARAEQDLRMRELLKVAGENDIPVHWDDEFFTIGDGHRSRQWLINELPTVDEMLTSGVGRIPKAVITGSNGKTTTTRALASILSLISNRVGYSSTDGIVVGGEVVDEGDYSGPMGLRFIMRNPDVEIAILETARGGLLRRGLATQDADVAVVTNVSVDHFGEYGVHTLRDLANVKLLVHKSLRRGSRLVVNAGDALLTEEALRLTDTPKAWFARSLSVARKQGLPACGVQDGRLVLVTLEGAEIDLGETAAMPISLQDKAQYNLENLGAAALASHLMGVDAALISAALLTFGSRDHDNLGRLQYWLIDGVHVILDYAHNPDGLGKLLDVASHFRGEGRMGLVLEQAGNRTDEAIIALANVGASAKPDRVWLKDIGGEYLRGRVDGEVVAILRDTLLRSGMSSDQLPVITNVEQLIGPALEWAQPGDILVLPIHEPDQRKIALETLESLAS